MTHESLIQYLEDDIEKRVELNKTLIDLMARSDERMAKTNDMCHEMSSTVKGLLKEYGKHIAALQKVRDEQLSLLQECQKTIDKLTQDLRDERARSNSIIEKVLLSKHATVQVH